MARRSGPGSAPRTFWIPLSPLTSIGPIRKSQPRDHVEGPGVVCLLASGAARRRGALSQIQPLWLPPIATRGRHHRSTNRFFRTSFPMTPCLRLITCTGADYYPGYLARAFHSLVAKSCFATANISERFSLV